MTPDMTPAIPIRAKLVVDNETAKGLKWLTKKANRKPKMQPTYKLGANVPPTPPPPLVAAVANTLKRTIRARNRANTPKLSFHA